MYKSKLQELCHKQKWALPIYTCLKDGQDHCPQFKASVLVSGISFDTSTLCKSSKQAHNEAAKLAFLHFTTEDSSQMGENIDNTNRKNEVQSSKGCSESVAVKNDLEDQFKKKLEIYAYKKNLDLPVYNTEREDPRSFCFRARVSIGEDWFQSRELHKTADEAENAAAQAALLSLLTDALHENDPCSYKNLLQELTRNEGFSLPMYTTIKSCEPHCTVFLSTVEVEGEVFQGASAKSKNVAEQNAAKAAYTVFMERKFFQPGSSTLSLDDDIVKLVPCSSSITSSELQVNFKPGCPSNFASSEKHKTDGEHSTGENEGIDRHCDKKSDIVKFRNEVFIGLSILPVPDKLTGSRKLGCSVDPPCFSTNRSESSTASINDFEASLPNNVGSSMKRTPEMKSYLLCNRFKIFSYIPNIALPEGTVLLPISENRWAMVNLEFPNDKDM